MLNISVIDASSHRRPVREGKSVSKPRLLIELEATKQLDRIAPDWPLHLYDGVVIDHILKVVNQAAHLVQKSCDATVLAAPPPIWPKTRPGLTPLSAPFKVMLPIMPRLRRKRVSGRRTDHSRGRAHTADHETRRRFRAAGLAGTCSPARGSGCALEEGAGGCRNCGKVGGGGAMVCILARQQALTPTSAACPGRAYKDCEAVRKNHHGDRKIRVGIIGAF